MYWVHLDSGTNQGETPGIGESPSNQPISGLVIFSKRQALSRAVVVNSNMSRGKYLAREGPGSRLSKMLPVSILLIANSVIKSTRSMQSGTTVTKKSMQTIVTNAGGVEPAESSTIAGSAKGYSTRGSCEDTGPL